MAPADRLAAGRLGRGCAVARGDGQEDAAEVRISTSRCCNRLPGVPLHNWGEGCSFEGHFDLGRVAGCPPPFIVRLPLRYGLGACGTYTGFCQG